ncbi:MAG: hypothetical protein IPN83_07580 [Holophagales bacterium]|nr:hypothetical protein [Holophagales bacterium]
MPRPPGPLIEHLLEARAGVPGARLKVLHLGDSHVGAEPLSSALKELLGALAGGDGGPGLFFPGLPFNGTRSRGVELKLSAGWLRSYGSAPLPPGDTGLSGGFVEARRTGETLRVDGPFAALELFLLRQPGGGAVRVRVDGRIAGGVDLGGASPDLAVFRWSGPAASRVEVETSGAGPVRILGISLTNGRPGLVYSPAGVVGAQANVLLRCREELFVRQLAADPPDLVILAFGTNEARETAFDPVVYGATLETVIRRVRRGAPSAMVLLTAPPDQERTTAGGSRPVPALSLVTEAQRLVARRTGSAFFDLREAMGGAGSVRRWIRSTPSLAQPDHVHFTTAGYERLARLVAGELARTFETGRQRFASASAGLKEAALAARPVVLPDELPRPARLARSVPAGGDGRTASSRTAGGGDLHSYRDSSGRLVVTNLGVAPPRTPELGRRSVVKR